MDKPEIKITKENTVYINEYGTLFDDDVIFLPKKIRGKYVRWKWNSPYSVGILPILRNGDFCLIESFRHAARTTVIEIPKGYGENLIDPIDTAKRELAEEVGLTSNNWEYQGKFFADTSFTYHPLHLFIAWDCEEHIDKPEDYEVIVSKLYYPLSAIAEITNDKKIDDGITLLSLLLADQGRK